MADRKYREIDSEFVTLAEVGQEVEGTILERDSVTFRTGGVTTEVGRYLLEREDGSKVRVLGATTLDDKLASIPDGEFVSITFLGEGKTTGGNKIKQFRVLVADTGADAKPKEAFDKAGTPA